MITMLIAAVAMSSKWKKETLSAKGLIRRMTTIRMMLMIEKVLQAYFNKRT